MIAGESTHPRKGTETALTAGTSYCLSRANQLIPARGRKRILLRTVPPPFENQLIPARGRKLRLPTVSLSSSMNQLIPARGRKQILCSLHIAFRGINSSPQGDGNGAGLREVSERHGINSSPQGDGNALSTVPLASAVKESTHPRKGTETFFYLFFVCAFMNQLIPARGRKLFFITRLKFLHIESTHPRKGTETRKNPHLGALE